MARTNPTVAAAAVLKHGRHLLRRLVSPFVVSSPAILHAAWITSLLAVCLALCIIHSRKPPPSSSSSSKAARRERGASSSTRRRSGPGDGGSSGRGGAGCSTTAAATPPAKVSPTPSDAAKANGLDSETQAAAAEAEGRVQGGGSAAGPVTVIDVGTHGPIAAAFPAPDPQPPRRSLSVKHMRLAERLSARIRSTRWGRDDDDDDGRDDDDENAGGDPAAAAAEESTTLWTKTIILGERCRVEDDGDGDAVVRWKSYRPRQPRSLPITRSNSFAGMGSLQLQGGGGGGASRPPAADVPFHLGRRASLPAKDEK
uniref:Uncharacterized protein n=1 Tax=Oryza punctata TaxID=4537 RepID=A0A0E0M2D6_ORYPU